MGRITGDGTAVTGLGGARGYGETELPRGDDSVAQVDVSAVFENGFTLAGVHYAADALFVSTDGLISFGSAVTGVAASLDSIAAPFFAIFNADVDTRLDGEGAESGGVWLDVDAAADCVTITWDHVGFYRRNATLTNTFQIQLFDRGNGGFDLVFRYQDISWSSGDLQGGWGGLGGLAALIGLRGAASGLAQALAASGDEAALLALADQLGNSGVKGLWHWDFTQASEIKGTNAADSLAGTGQDDLMRGLGGADEMYGKAGDDRLQGGRGGDLLQGDGGRDRLDGGAGDDSLTGGGGADQFRHQGRASQGTDWITDFAHAEGDRLWWAGGAATRADFAVELVTLPGAGDASVAEVRVTYLPTGLVVWTIVDGADEARILVQSSMNSFDLL